MSKKTLLRKDSFQLPCGQAKPGQKLASLDTMKKSVKVMGSFCRDFNEKTKELGSGKIVNVKIKVFSDGTYKFAVKSQITSDLIKQAAGKKKPLVEPR